MVKIHFLSKALLSVLLISLTSCQGFKKDYHPNAFDLDKRSQESNYLFLSAHPKDVNIFENDGVPRYFLEVVNLTPANKFFLYKHTFAGRWEYLGQFYVGDNQRLCSYEHPGCDYVIIFRGFLPGEGVDYFLTDEKKNNVARVHIIPIPMEVKRRTGLSLSLELMDPNGLLFFARANGFRPREELKIKATFNGEEQEMVGQTDLKGNISFWVTPPSATEDGGEGELDLIAIDKEVSICYPWGSEYIEWANELIQDLEDQFK